MAVKYKDYYEILEVKRQATADEVKSSYRKLARKFHPDLNKDDPKSEARFKEIQEAYDVLGDAEKRRRYDMLGGNYRDGGEFNMPSDWGNASGSFRPGGQSTGGMGGGFSDFFEMLFGGAGGNPFRTGGSRTAASSGRRTPRSPRRGLDVETALQATVEEVYIGATRKIRVNIKSTCPACQGSGVIAGSRCGVCSGDGMVPRPKTMEIKIPMGVKDGTRLRLAGQGEPSLSAAGEAGDLLVKINYATHPVFSLRGTNVHIELPVAPWEAVLGGEVEVPTPGGMLKMKLPPGTQNGTKMRLRQRGLPSGHAHGDEIVHIKVMIPKDVTDRERQLFRQLRDISHFRPRVKDRTTQ